MIRKLRDPTFESDISLDEYKFKNYNLLNIKRAMDLFLFRGVDRVSFKQGKTGLMLA